MLNLAIDSPTTQLRRTYDSTLDRQYRATISYTDSLERFGIIDKVSDFVKDARDYVKSFYADSSFDLIRYRRDGSIERALTKADATTLQSLTISPIPGLKGSYDEILTVLENALPMIVSIDKDLIKPSSRLLGTLASQPETLNGPVSSEVLKLTDLYNKEIDSWMKGLSGISMDEVERSALKETGPYLDYFDNMKGSGDYVGIAKRMESIVRAYASIDRRSLEKAVDGLYARFDTILKYLDEDASSTAWVTALTDYAHHLANVLTTYAVFSHTLQDVERCLTDGIDHLRKQL